MVGIQTDKKRHNKKQVCKGEGGKRRRKNSDTLKRYDAAWGQIKSGDTNFSFFFFLEAIEFPENNTKTSVFFSQHIQRRRRTKRKKNLVHTDNLSRAMRKSRNSFFYTPIYEIFFCFGFQGRTGDQRKQKRLSNIEIVS